MAQQVKQRLEQCGWKDEVRLECNKIIKQRGLENIDMGELVQEVTPFARGLKKKIKNYLYNNNLDSNCNIVYNNIYLSFL